MLERIWASPNAESKVYMSKGDPWAVLLGTMYLAATHALSQYRSELPS